MATLQYLRFRKNDMLVEEVKWKAYLSGGVDGEEGYSRSVVLKLYCLCNINVKCLVLVGIIFDSI